jgi:hypothetical protein
MNSTITFHIAGMLDLADPHSSNFSAYYTIPKFSYCLFRRFKYLTGIVILCLLIVVFQGFE